MKSAFFSLIPALMMTQANAMVLPEHDVHPYECTTCESLSRTTLSTAWAIHNDATSHETQRSQKSRSYRLVTSLSQLGKGLNLPVLGAGAVIRITPAGKTLATAKPEFRLRKNDKTWLLKDASQLMSQNQAMSDAEFSAPNQALFQLKPELGAGPFILTASDLAGKPTDAYVVQVLDQGSNTYLHVETDKARYQLGDDVTITFRLQDGAYGYPIDVIEATLVSPDGDKTALDLERKRWDTYLAHAHMSDKKNPRGKNWYIEADVSTWLNDQSVLRHVHTALSYAIPSATLTEIKTVDDKATSFTVGVNVATASRYVLQAVFQATNSKGQKEAVETVHTAAWLEAGRSQLTFSMPAEIANHHKPPYYLASLTLVDYGQMKTVYEYNKPIDVRSLR